MTAIATKLDHRGNRVPAHRTGQFAFVNSRPHTQADYDHIGRVMAERLRRGPGYVHDVLKRSVEARRVKDRGHG